MKLELKLKIKAKHKVNKKLQWIILIESRQCITFSKQEYVRVLNSHYSLKYDCRGRRRKCLVLFHNPHIQVDGIACYEGILGSGGLTTRKLKLISFTGGLTFSSWMIFAVTGLLFRWRPG